MEIWILGIVISIQALFSLIAIFLGLRIRGIFDRQNSTYYVTDMVFSTPSGDISRPVIDATKTNKYLKDILASVNDYLKGHYIHQKSPDVSLINNLVRDQIRVNDATASLMASFPILIGLAGTIMGLILAFQNINNAVTASSFTEHIFKSASIVFWGSLSGISFTIVINYIVAYCKTQRDIRYNLFTAFIHTSLTPRLPTVKEEAIQLISTQLSAFENVYFQKFDAYNSEFDRLITRMQGLYKMEFFDIIEKNSHTMVLLNDNIHALKILDETTKKITLTPEMIIKLVSSSNDLIQSNTITVDKLKEYTTLFRELNNSFNDLQSRIDTGVGNIMRERHLLPDLQMAMKTFADSIITRTEDMSRFAEKFDASVRTELAIYQHSLAEIRNKVLSKIEQEINPDEYKLIIGKLERLSNVLDNEADILTILSTTLQDLDNTIGNDLTPSISGVSKIVADLERLLEHKIPQSLNETLSTNKTLLEETWRKPRSFGELVYSTIYKGKTGK